MVEPDYIYIRVRKALMGGAGLSFRNSVSIKEGLYHRHFSAMALHYYMLKCS